YQAVDRCPVHSLLYHCPFDDRDLHSFPTRRSSDLSSRPRWSTSKKARLLLVPLPRWPMTGFTSMSAISLKGSSPSASSATAPWRSEEHTSEFQSRENLVCRLLLEKKN